METTADQSAMLNKESIMANADTAIGKADFSSMDFDAQRLAEMGYSQDMRRKF